MQRELVISVFTTNSNRNVTTRWLPLLKITVLTITIVSFAGIFTAQFARDITKSSDLEDVNNRINRLYNNFTFLDPKLRVRNYSIVPNQTICSNKLFIVVVHVRAEDGYIRNRWRKTYGNYELKEKLKYNLIFSIGKNQSNEELQKNITAESRTYGDVLQADYMDTYRNLTLKHLAGLRYVATMCPNVKAVVKLDDDVAWDTEAIAKFINDTLETEDMFCNRQIGVKPVRNTKDKGLTKWLVSEKEWERKIFPTHCSGMAYISALPLIQRLLKVVHMQKHFWIDDIFVTGVLAEASNVIVGSLPDIMVVKVERMKEKFYLIDKNDISYWFVASNIDPRKIVADIMP